MYSTIQTHQAYSYNCQACFYNYIQLFANSVKPWWYATGPVEPVSSTNKDVCGTKLLPIDCLSLSCGLCLFLSVIENSSTAACGLMECITCNCPKLSTLPHHLPLTHTLIHVTCDITVAVKKLLQIQQC